MGPEWLVVGAVLGTFAVVAVSYVAGRNSVADDVRRLEDHVQWRDERLASAEARIVELSEQGLAGAEAAAGIVAAERELLASSPDPRRPVEWGLLRWSPSAPSGGGVVANPPPGEAGGDGLGSPSASGGLAGRATAARGAGSGDDDDPPS